jgi:Arc/MetJ family transcription regulator
MVHPRGAGKACAQWESRIENSVGLRHAVRMKRTNLVLDERLLEQATKLAGEKTYSAVVQRALTEFVRRIQARQILGLAGSGLWEGNLSEMRADAPRASKRKRRS